MYQLLIRNVDRSINYKQSLLNILRHKTSSQAITDFSIQNYDGTKFFALSFSDPVSAQDFHNNHPQLGLLGLLDIDTTNQDSPKIILNQSNCFIYLFNNLVDAEQLLTNSSVPPALRVDLFEGFIAEVIRPLVFHGPRAEELQVDYNPIQFKNGKIHVTLRGQVPDQNNTQNNTHNNTQIEFEDFDKLALICISSEDHASHLPAIKQLLFAYNIKYILKSSTTSSLSELEAFSTSKVKISAISASARTGKLFVHLHNTLGIYHPLDIRDVKKFRLALDGLIGQDFTVKSSLNEYGISVLEILPSKHIGFTIEDIKIISFFLTKFQDVLFVSYAPKINITELNTIIRTSTRERFAFDDCDSLKQAFCDPISLDIILDPIIIGEDGQTHSAGAIQALLSTAHVAHVNPLTRKPIQEIRENNLLTILRNHYKTHGYAIKPSCLDNITNPCIVPNGETYDVQTLKQLFLEQNQIDETKLSDNTTATLADNSTIRWCDIWPNRAIESVLDYYKAPPNYSQDRSVVDNPDSPLLSLAATIASLLESDNSLSKEQASKDMITGKLPIQVIWSSEPRGLRLNFTDDKLAQEILSVLTHNGINVSYDTLIHASYTSLIFFPAVSLEDITGIKKFIYDICNYSRAYTGFDKFFTEEDFRAESGPRASARRQAPPHAVAAGSADSSLTESEHQELVLIFLRAIFYGTTEEITRAYEAIPLEARRIYNQRTSTNFDVDLTRIPTAAHMPSAATNPIDLMAILTPTPMDDTGFLSAPTTPPPFDLEPPVTPDRPIGILVLPPAFSPNGHRPLNPIIQSFNSDRPPLAPRRRPNPTDAPPARRSPLSHLGIGRLGSLGTMAPPAVNNISNPLTPTRPNPRPSD